MRIGWIMCICNRHPSDLGPKSSGHNAGHVDEFRSVECLNALRGEFHSVTHKARRDHWQHRRNVFLNRLVPCIGFRIMWKYECKLHRLQANSKFRSKLAAVQTPNARHVFV
jgi:hypothetical protein